MAHTSLSHGGYNAGVHLTCQIIIYREGMKLMVRKRKEKEK